MSNKSLREKAIEYKIKTGYANSTPEERKKIADDMLSAMSGLKKYDNRGLISRLNELRWGCRDE